MTLNEELIEFPRKALGSICASVELVLCIANHPLFFRNFLK